MNCERNICYQQEYNGGCDTCPCNRTADKNSSVEMTYEEAIVKFKGIMKAEIERIPSHYDAEVNDDVYDNIDRIDEILELNKIVIEALEKQVPKKPIESKYGEQISCPHCSATLIYCLHSYKGNYCEECGQAILWEDCD